MSDQKSSQELKTDNLQIHVKREPGCSVVLDVTISPKAVEAAYQKALKNINKEISFPGFRKGHAPAQVIEQKFSKEIQSEMQRVVSETAFTEAVNQCKIYPRTEKSVKNVDLKSLSRTEGAVLHVEFECQPDVPEVDLNGFSFQPVSAQSLTPEDVENALHNLRLDKSTLEVVEGRPAQEGDFVMVDMDALVGENKDPVRLIEGRVMELGSKFTPEWLNKLVIGLNVGESADGEMDCNATDHHGHSHGRRVTLLEIKTGILAPLTEELMKSVGCESEEMLRERIQKQLERNEADRVQYIKSGQLEEFLGNNYDFDVPKSMYEGTVKQLVQRQVAALKKNEGWEANFAEKSEEIKHTVESDLKKALRRFLLCNRVAQDNNITVSEQEMYMEHINEMMREGRKEQLDQDGIARIYSKLLQQKVLNFLANKAEGKV